MGKYFGTDGVRGEANVELTPELAFKLGRFGGYVLSQHETEAPKVFVGRDTRISGEMLESALVAGLLSVGIHVYKLGVLATPAVAYLVKTEGASAGVMISASHNPALDNGIKFFGGCWTTTPCGFIRSRPPLRLVVSWYQKFLIVRSSSNWNSKSLRLTPIPIWCCSIFVWKASTMTWYLKRFKWRTWSRRWFVSTLFSLSKWG